MQPRTADERERRIVEYLLTLNKGQIAEFRLGRLNRVANFRKAIAQLIEEFVEARAEEIAAGMIEQWAPERPKKKEDVTVDRLPVPAKARTKRRRMPVWVKRLAEAENGRVTVER